MKIEEIGHIITPFKTKFGIPRQGGIANSIRARLVFEPKYRSAEAVRGLEGFNYVWIIWGFSENEEREFSPTVRPPRLGGNKRVGVFATRSPFRPNRLGLSCLKLEKIEYDSSDGPVLILAGADMVNNTPVYDIKPYVPHADLRPDAIGGFADTIEDYILEVDFKECKGILTEEEERCLIEILREDPRPSYIENDERVYGFFFDKYEIKFTVEGKRLDIVSWEKIK